MSAPAIPRTTAAVPVSPGAIRSARPGWRDPRLALGVGLVAVCALLGARLLGGADDTVAVWSLTANKVAGQPVDVHDVQAIRVRFEDTADADRYLSADDPLPEGAAVARDLGAGELLPRASLRESGATELVELPLTVPSETLPVTLRLGSVVDVWVTAKDSELSSLVLDDVPVVALPGPGSSLSPSSNRQVIVGLSVPQQAELPRALAQLTHGVVVMTSRSSR